MIRYEALWTLYKDFADALQKAAHEAKSEMDFAILEDIATDVMTTMPPTILTKDYVGRGTIASYLDEADREDTEKINKFMMQIYEDDVFHLQDDYLCEDLEYAATKFYKKLKE